MRTVVHFFRSCPGQGGLQSFYILRSIYFFFVPLVQIFISCIGAVELTSRACETTVTVFTAVRVRECVPVREAQGRFGRAKNEHAFCARVGGKATRGDDIVTHGSPSKYTQPLRFPRPWPRALGDSGSATGSHARSSSLNLIGTCRKMRTRFDLSLACLDDSRGWVGPERE
ncbi:unnamed protein product, partial [Pylaiella littoralis]